VGYAGVATFNGVPDVPKWSAKLRVYKDLCKRSPHL